MITEELASGLGPALNLARTLSYSMKGGSLCDLRGGKIRLEVIYYDARPALP